MCACGSFLSIVIQSAYIHIQVTDSCFPSSCSQANYHIEAAILAMHDHLSASSSLLSAPLLSFRFRCV